MDIASWDVILSVIPEPLKTYLTEAISDADKVIELRIRRGQNVQIFTSNRRFFLDEQYGFHADEAFCAKLLDRAAQQSLFSVQHQMANGFICLAGGVRAGIAGGFLHGEQGICPVTSFCFRAPHAILGAADKLMQRLFPNGELQSTLVISPPGMGKTTLLRDMARCASYMGKNVSIIDERGEFSGWRQGETAFDLGPCTDIFYDIDPARGIMLCIRSLAPELIVCDEIGRVFDAEALREAARCGVCVFASAHAKDVSDLYARPMLRACMQEKLFSHIVVLENRGKIRQIIETEAMQCGCSG